MMRKHDPATIAVNYVYWNTAEGRRVAELEVKPHEVKAAVQNGWVERHLEFGGLPTLRCTARGENIAAPVRRQMTPATGGEW